MPHFAAGVIRFRNEAYPEKNLFTYRDSEDHEIASVPVDGQYADELANLPANRTNPSPEGRHS